MKIRNKNTGLVWEVTEADYKSFYTDENEHEVVAEEEAPAEEAPQSKKK